MKKNVFTFSTSAYTMAKYGMSMCVLGMSGEFKQDGIAVNALWPKTGKFKPSQSADQINRLFLLNRGMKILERLIFEVKR